MATEQEKFRLLCGDFDMAGVDETIYFLQREMRGVEQSRRFLEKSDSNRITYLFDQTVLTAYADFFRTGPLNTKTFQHGWGQIFPPWQSKFAPDDRKSQAEAREKNTARTMVRTLCNYTFSQAIKTDGGIQLLPNHFEEFEVAKKGAIAKSIESKLDLEARNKFLSDRALAVLMSKQNTMGEAEFERDILNFLTTTMTETYETSNNAVALEAQNYAAIDTKFGEPKEQSLGDFSELETHVYSILTTHFNRRLGGLKSSLTSSRFHRDAEALTELAILNKRELNAKTPNRFVFVTCDRSLVLACYGNQQTIRYEIETYVVNRRDELADPTKLKFDLYDYFGLEGESKWWKEFALRYVRHIWAFAEKTLTTGNDATLMEHIFSGSTSRTAQKALLASTKDLENEVLKEATRRQRRHQPKYESNQENQILHEWENILTRWRDFVAGALSERQLEIYDINVDHALSQQIAEEITTNDKIDRQRLSKRISELILRARDRSMVEFSDYGVYDLILNRNLSVRNPPNLFFDTLQYSQHIFDQLAKKKYTKDNAKTYLEDFGEIMLDTYSAFESKISDFDSTDDRQLSHLKMVVLGATFASAQRWGVALVHAKASISIVKRSQETKEKIKTRDDGSQISGREAYFLASICYRMQGDIIKAQEYLNFALDAAKSDIEERVKAKKDTTLYLPKGRFESEELAIKLANYYSKRSTNEPNFFSGLVKEIYLAAAEILKEFPLNNLPSESITDQLSLISICTNLIQTRVIREYRIDILSCSNPNANDLEEKCSECSDPVVSIEVLGQSIAKILRLNNKFRTDLVEMYLMVGRIIYFSEQNVCEPEFSIPTEEEFNCAFEDRIEQEVSEYDNWRYQKLYEFGRIKLDMLLNRNSSG